MNRTAADIVQDYINGIADIDKRIDDLRKEAHRQKKNPSICNELNIRINALSDMRSDMAFALYRLQKYGGVK